MEADSTIIGINFFSERKVIFYNNNKTADDMHNKLRSS